MKGVIKVKKQRNSRRSGGRGATVEEQRYGSRKCVLKAVQLVAVIDELDGKVPMHAWVHTRLDDLVRLLETDPFAGEPRPPVEAMLPAEYGFTSLTLETYFLSAVEWWAKAQHTKQQRDKYLQKNMYTNTALYDHFVDRRNNLGGHFPNTEQSKVPGGRWVVARGYFPRGRDALPALKHLLAESMSLLVPPQLKEETRSKILGVFGVDPDSSVMELRIPSARAADSYSLVIEEPTRLLYLVTPLLDGKWTAEAWEIDESNADVPGGRHFGVASETVWDSPHDAVKSLIDAIHQEISGTEAS